MHNLVPIKQLQDIAECHKSFTLRSAEVKKYPNFEWRGGGEAWILMFSEVTLLWVQCLNNFVVDCRYKKQIEPICIVGCSWCKHSFQRMKSSLCTSSWVCKLPQPHYHNLRTAWPKRGSAATNGLHQAGASTWWPLEATMRLREWHNGLNITFHVKHTCLCNLLLGP